MSYLSFNVRPSVVLPDHRPLYKITQLLLVLSLASHGKKSSLIRLQLFNWALKEDERRQKLLQASEDRLINFPAWGVDPTLNAAIALAKADELIEATSTGYRITLLGQKFCALVLAEGLFDEDLQFLKQIRNSITEKMVDEIVDKWG